jgi:dethiobiotin synthetase
MRGLFVTGTDTGVGKTMIAGALAHALTGHGIAVAVRKPVESGCERAGDELHPADGSILRAAAGEREPLETVTPLRLVHALSPERAARIEGMELELYDLIAAVRIGAPGDFYLVEGAGGFLSPLAKDALNADLAVALGLPVLLVVADRLGCINHALLTAEAIERRGLRIVAAVVNAVTPAADEGMDNREDLASRLPCPVLPFAHGDDREAAERLARLLMTGPETAADPPVAE